MSKRIGMVFWIVLTLIWATGCGTGIEETEDETLPQERKFAAIPLRVDFKGDVSLQDFKTDSANLGLSMKEGASFVYRDMVFTNSDEEAQIVEYRFEEFPILEAYTKLSWGVYQSSDTVLHHRHENLFFIRHDFTLPEPRVRIVNEIGETRFEPFLLNIEAQTLVIPGKSEVTVELVFKRPEAMVTQSMGSPCYDIRQAWYSVIGWKTEIQYSRDLCLIEKSRRCLSEQNWISLSRVSHGTGQQKRGGLEAEASKAFDEVLGSPFSLLQNVLIDYSNINVQSQSDSYCTRWIR